MLLDKSELLSKIFLIVWMEHYGVGTVNLSDKNRVSDTFIRLDCLRVGRVSIGVSMDRVNRHLDLVKRDRWLLDVFQVAYHAFQIVGIK